jgi:competence protein ComEA
MKNWWGIAFGVICGLLTAGILSLLIHQPKGDTVLLRPPPTPLPIVVHVAGAVKEPGIYSLLPGSRVEAALQAAGGAVAAADLEAINLAAFLEDGEQIWVPEEIAEEALNPEKSEGEEAQQPPADFDVLININIADQAELEMLPGIGPVLAKAILDYRRDHGPFKDISELEDVPGIGPGIFEKIKDRITIWRRPVD